MGRTDKVYQTLYKDDPQKFQEMLVNNIIRGEDREKETLALLAALNKCKDRGRAFIRNMRDNDDTILNLAAKFDKGSKVLTTIMDICPSLVCFSRKDPYEGQTTLHIVICKKNKEAVAYLLDRFVHETDAKLLRMAATGSRFTNTIMMGELPFSVAALTLDVDIIHLMNEKGTPDMISFQNSYGDTVFHSLIKYACLQPKKVGEIIKICIEINSYLAKRRDDDFNIVGDNLRLDQTDPMAVWFLQNYNSQTPLQLAASLEQVEIFEYILNIENVYCCLDHHDGLFDVHLYDITEIDTVPITEKQLSEDKGNKSKVYPRSEVEVSTLKVDVKETRFKRERAELKKKRSKPILETMCEIDVQKAFKLVKMLVMTSIIKAKWSRYQWIYYTWAIFHFLYMCTLTYYAVIKTEDLNRRLLGKTDTRSGNSAPKTFYQCVYTCVQNMNPQPEPNTTNQQVATTSTTSENKVLLIIIPSTNILIAVVFLLFEIIRKGKGYHYHIKQIHHNGTYRLILCVFSICLIIDAIWYLAKPHNNYFLILSILIGWWFLTFFLRAIKKFSFFTVMLQKIIHGDGFRFLVILVIEFLSFTIAMHITFLDTKPDEFETIWQSALTMFNLMLGLSELNILMQAREPWVAGSLYALFIMLTYVLMLNALIAMMSQTCSEISANKKVQAELQRLSVIIFLESVLPNRFKVSCGTVKIAKHFDIYQQQIVLEQRYFLEIASLQSKYTKGSAILSRRKIVQTLRFGDLSQDWGNKKRKPSKRLKSYTNDYTKDVSDGLHISNVRTDDHQISSATTEQSGSVSASMGDRNPDIT